MLVPYSIEGDSWAWLVWGREVRHLALDTPGGTTWKPLEVLLTTVISLFGTAATGALVFVSRTAWLLAIVLAYRIGKRLAGPAAGLVGAAGLLLIPDHWGHWLMYSLGGYSDPLVVALALGAVDRHLAGHRGQALALGCLAGLGRPEVWPVALAYAVAVWPAQLRRRLAVAALLAAVPLLWLGGGVWGASDPLRAAHSAQAAGRGADARHRFTARSTRAPARRPPLWRRTLETVSELVILPFALAALAAVARALPGARKGHDRIGRATVMLAVVALGWLAVVIAGGLFFGLPAIARFMLGPAAIISVLGGVGFVQLVRGVRHPAVRVVVAAALGGVTLILALPRLQALPVQARPREDARKERQSLVMLLERSNAKQHLARCGGKVGVVKANAAMMAWRLGIPLGAVYDARTRGGIRPRRGILVVHHRPPALSVGELTAGSTAPPTVRRIGASGIWSIYEVGCRRDV